MPNPTTLPPRKRVRRVINNPNPLFAQWLREWRDEAAQAGSHAKNTYARALQSLAKFPIPLPSGKDCIILKHFGQKICDMLDKKLAEHRRLHPNWRPEVVTALDTVDTGKNDAKTNREKEDASRGGRDATDRAPNGTRSIDNRASVMKVPPVAGNVQATRKKHASFATLKVNTKHTRAPPETTNVRESEFPVDPRRFRLDINVQERCPNVVNAVVSPLSEVPEAVASLEETFDFSIQDSPQTPPRRLDPPKQKPAEPPEVVDLSMDSPDRKQESEDDSILMPLSKRLAAAKTKSKRRAKVIDECVLEKDPVRVSSCKASIVANCDGDDNRNDADIAVSYRRTSGLAIEKRLASLRKLVSPVQTEVNPARLSPEPLPLAGPDSVEPTDAAFSQNSSFCPARTRRPATQESILDISAEIRQKRLSFLARLEAATPQAKAKYKSAVPDLLDTPPGSQTGSSRLANRSPELQPNPERLAENFRQKTPEKSSTREVVCISPDLPSATATNPIVVHELSDTDNDDDDLPPLAMRVNKRIEIFSPVEPTAGKGLLDSFAALVEDIASPPAVKAREPQTCRPAVEVRASKAEGAARRLMGARKKRTKDCEDEPGGSGPIGDLQGAQSEKKDRPKTEKTASASGVPLNPFRLQYVPEGSCPPRPLSATSACMSSRCPLAITLSPGTFQVVLCVDSCEATGGVYFSGAVSKKKEAMIDALRNSGVAMDVRKMNVGDFAWVAKADEKEELVLDCIVERKRSDDLASSIKDGRYREQKHRLLTSGISRKIYLVEDCNRFAGGGISDLALLQAQLNTQVIDDFIIKRTRSVKESAQYLATLTRTLAQRYEGRTLRSCLREEIGQLSGEHLMTWREFNDASTKRRKLCMRQALTRALMVLRGVSLEKALSIVSTYPTIASLVTAYEQIDEPKQREALLADLRCPISGRRLGPALSKAVYRFISGKVTS
ncbi:hypothetical protein BIW11_12049 [Tropilaelaps mercedesae]|uniref:Crossover junction endonuclease MUS81 n=1 Tax=Tropilaelaps mercedesae TaxID=418985 RepID=A0A1V9X8C1_9ACAR|nr:hypothetical protein BIW11_12049 [Tropilaelaps mercedesae]